MPELPEVEIVRLGLQKFLISKKLATVEISVPKLFIGDPKRIVHQEITQVRRRAKVLIIDFANLESLLIHLKMTGQLVYQSKDENEKVVGGHPQAVYNQPLPHKHTHIIFTFTDGSKLFFNDLRKFGWLQIVQTSNATTHGMLKTAGPEPLDESFTAAVLRDRVTKYPNRLIYVALLDQSLLAGIGNIYANEALYEAEIHPERKVKDIQAAEWTKLWQAIRHVLEVSIQFGGTSDSTYIHVDGQRGDYLKHAHVYHKKIASPCGHTITRKKIGGRTVHFCAVDQV